MVNEAGSILEALDLRVSRAGRTVIDDVLIELHEREMICLVGRSGVGKTTLFHTLAGLIEPVSGKVILKGKDITGKPGHISYMLQKDLLLKQRSVIDNVALPLVVRGMSKKAARAEARSYFAEFGLEGTQDLDPYELSGGMRQRAAMLRTYLNNSDVVLMDEPFSALDALLRVDMRAWYLHMMDKLGFASILITHDVDEAIALADRVLVLGCERGATTNDHADLGDSSDRSVDAHAGTIVASIDVTCPRSERDDFILSSEALTIKREILSYL